MSDSEQHGTSRRDLLKLIGTVAGSAAMYQAMTSLGVAAESLIAGRSSWRAIPRAPRS